MSKRQTLVLLGIWIMIFLFISFPAVWDKIFALVTGLLIVIIAFKLPSQRKNSQEHSPYVETKKTTQVEYSAAQSVENTTAKPIQPETQFQTKQEPVQTPAKASAQAQTYASTQSSVRSPDLSSTSTSIPVQPAPRKRSKPAMNDISPIIKKDLESNS